MSYFSSTFLYLSVVQAMLMLSRIAFLQLSLEKRVADLQAVDMCRYRS